MTTQLPPNFASDCALTGEDDLRMAPRLFALAFSLASPSFWVQAPHRRRPTASRLDGTTVTASEADGEYTAEISLINAGTTTLTLPSSVEAKVPCTVDIDDNVVEPARSTVAKLTFDKQCFGDAASFTVDLDSNDGPLPAVKIKKPGEKRDWAPMGIAALIALGLGLISFAFGWIVTRSTNTRFKAEVTDREVSYRKLRTVVDQRTDDLAVARLPWVVPHPPRRTSG